MDISKEPTLIDKAKSFGTAAANWAAKDGFQKVSEEQFQERKKICLSCPNWDQAAYASMGKCKLCGCSAMKLYMPHSQCPDNPPRWGSIKVEV